MAFFLRINSKWLNLSRKRFHFCSVTRWFVKSLGRGQGSRCGPVQMQQNQQRAFLSTPSLQEAVPTTSCVLCYDTLAGNDFVQSTVTCTVPDHALPGVQSPSVLPLSKERGQSEAGPALSFSCGVTPAPSSACVIAWSAAGFLGSASALQVSATFHTQPGPWTSALPVQKLGGAVGNSPPPPRPLPRLAFISKALAFGII